jgi:cytosine/adenosine deaminase-related metal-dependent hydrolase
MSYRKFQADHLFTGSKMLSNRQVLITKPCGEIVTIINEADAGIDIEIFKGILSPGFVNAHCHLELSHMHGLIPEKTGLVDFVFKVVNERYFNQQQILEAINKAEQQMLKSGIVAVGDISNNILTLPQKLKHKLHYYNFIEVSGWAPSIAQARWERSKSSFDLFTERGLTASVVPHAPYSVSNQLWEKLIPTFQGKTISIHNQETDFENELFIKGTGDFLRMYKLMGIDNSLFSPTKKSSLQTCFNYFSNAASIILVHNTYTSEADIDYIQANKKEGQLISFCLCPNANLYIENTFPPVELLVNNDCVIVLGTDSMASNHELNILSEIKTIQYNFPSLSLEKILQWATINGAKALQMDHMLGSFDKGKTPGVVLIENAKDGKLNLHSVSKKLL